MSSREAKVQIRKERRPIERFHERDEKPTKTGAVAEDPIGEDDERREAAAFGSAKRRRANIPPWFRELARTRAAPEKVLESLVAQLPDMRDSETVRLMVNEMGRVEAAADVLRRNLIPEVAKNFHPEE